MPTIWNSQPWRDEVEAWIRDSVTAAGHELTGPVEQVRVRMWSTQLTVKTTAGLVWFKENHPGQRAEAAVVDELARLAPDHVVKPLAAERSRGWLLTPDHGRTLATLASIDEDTWCRVVAEFADLQRRVADHREELMNAGLLPLLPEMAAEYIEDQIARMRGLAPGDLAYVGPELAERVLRALPAVGETARRLAAAAPPVASLDHNDLHQNNVFIPHADETTLRFFDFGDAFWAHPFTTLSVPVGVLCRDWKTEPHDPRIVRVVDSYLEVWSDLGQPAELREAARLAQEMYPVHRFESWRRILEGSPRDEHPDVSETLEYWLGRLADISAR
ncbi:MAG: hypothetical protein QOI06_914 [Nocardioidaceae bacterium]|jgi:hypothetical protein|nr:hypothetical protein [Nocardioidaceae bacterium]